MYSFSEGRFGKVERWLNSGLYSIKDVYKRQALVSAGGAWMATGELIRAGTILVVFCPCALVLATPTAVMAAIGNATRHGFLVRSCYIHDIGSNGVAFVGDRSCYRGPKNYREAKGMSLPRPVFPHPLI